MKQARYEVRLEGMLTRELVNGSPEFDESGNLVFYEYAVNIGRLIVLYNREKLISMELVRNLGAGERCGIVSYSIPAKCV